MGRGLPKTAFALVLAGALAGSTTLAWPAVGHAVDYNDTNPAATPCGDGSHPVEDWQSSWIRNTSGLIIALVEVRRSDYCNTVWTRVTNETGRGSGYATGATEAVTENIYLYSCPLGSCLVSHLAATDTLYKFGTVPYQGWSHQHCIPTGTNLGSPAAKQPPAFQGTALVSYGGTNYGGGVGFQPVFTHLTAGYPNNPLSCDNSTNRECKSWGEGSGSFATVYARLDSSLSGALGGIDLGSDFSNTVVPIWNSAWTHNPLILMCSSCTEQILVELTPLPPGLYAQTTDDNNTATLPEIMLHRTIQLGAAVTWDHHCNSSDSGCNTSGPGFSCDARVCISHETGHAEGLGHCGFDFGVMCQVSSTAHGTAFWHPQPQEVLGLQTVYP